MQIHTTIFIEYFIKFVIIYYSYILLQKKVIIYLYTFVYHCIFVLLYLCKCHIHVKYARMTHQVTHLKI